MPDIRIYKQIDPAAPIMIAGWPGMGNVALGAVNYLRRKLKPELFAEIDSAQFFTPESVSVQKGLAKLPPLPQSRFFFLSEPELIIFESDAQINGPDGLHLMNMILKFAKKMKVKRIYTGAAFPMPQSHMKEPSVYAVANQSMMLDWLPSLGLKIMKEGQIAGLNGLLLGYAREEGIDAVCLLATMPNYAISFPNPKSSKAILNVFTRILNIEIEMDELDIFSREMDKRLKAIEEKIQEMFPTAGKEEEIEEMEEKEVPKFIMEKVEKMFLQAKTKKSVAYELKEELDRWDLFKFYEDRFLDLFKEDQ